TTLGDGLPRVGPVSCILSREQCALAHPRLSHLFSFYSSAPHRPLHSFPTRRSSDLIDPFHGRPRRHAHGRRRVPGSPGSPPWTRSEEHTSELQSLRQLVCRLLLEKKKLQ